jgi:hypothetical protein
MQQKRTLILFLLIHSVIGGWAQSNHVGAYYSFGGSFNSHKTNDHKFRPSDGSTFGVYYHLENGENALGFRAAFAWRSDDVEFPIIDHFSIVNNTKSLELKLQCMLPISARSSIALGMAPRLVFHSKFSRLYYNTGRHATYEEQFSMSSANIDMNELNSALCLSWYFRISKHFQFGLNLDQDMITLYKSDAITLPVDYTEPLAFNARLTYLSGSLIFQLK